MAFLYNKDIFSKLGLLILQHSIFYDRNTYGLHNIILKFMPKYLLVICKSSHFIGYYLCVIIKDKKIHSKIFHYFHDNRNKLLVNYRKLYNKLVSKTLRNKLRNAECGKVLQIADYFTDGNK